MHAKGSRKKRERQITGYREKKKKKKKNGSPKSV